MAETAILYMRTQTTKRDATTYPNLLDELKSSYIPATNKLIFETRIKQFEGFRKTHKNKIRSFTHIDPDAQLSQKNKHYGLDSQDIDIFGNFKDKSHVTVFDNLVERNQTPGSINDGILGLFVVGSEFLNKDPGSGQAYVALGSEMGRVSKLSELWDFKITLRFGGIL